MPSRRPPTVSINVTVSFSVSQAVAAGEAIERGPARRDVEGADTASMGPVVTIMVGRLDDWLKAVVAREHLDVEPIPWKGRGGRLQAVGGTVRRARSASPAAGRRLPQFQWTGLVGDDVVLSPPFA